MFILNYLKSFLDYFKIFQKKSTLVLLGLDNAGKTTFLRRLKEDRMCIHDPTMYAHTEEIKLGNILFHIVDVGGHPSMRKIWKNFYMNTDAIIYMVDAADPSRFQEARDALVNIFNDSNAKNVPIIILGNKIDLKSARSENDLVDSLGIQELLRNEKDRKVVLFMCSISKKMGYKEALLWLNDQLSHK